MSVCVLTCALLRSAADKAEVSPYSRLRWHYDMPLCTLSAVCHHVVSGVCADVSMQCVCYWLVLPAPRQAERCNTWVTVDRLQDP